MQVQRTGLRRLFMVAAFLSAALVACEPDNDVHRNTPAYHIAESEKLAIPPAVDLPSNLPAGNSRVATYYAVGVQKYKAQLIQGSHPAAYQWVFVAPVADLYDATNAKVGTHTAGPTWQLSVNDSIYAQHFAPPRTAPSPDPNSIDWLLLMPKVGKTPTGVFADVDYIQRIDTNGGKAPEKAPKKADETAEVKYTAIYRFSKMN
jgi:Protein of unknown function (DUF3455)